MRPVVRSTGALLLLSVALNWQASQARDWIRRESRHNLFDPVYALDDVDAHYVSPTLAAASSHSPPPSTSTSLAAPNRDAEEAFRTLLRQEKDDSVLSQVSATSGSSIKTTPGVAPSIGGSTPTRVTSSYYTPNDESEYTRKEPAPTEQPRYWSALENYYYKMKRLPLPPAQSNQYPTYKIVQQEIDDSLNDYRPQMTNGYPAQNIMFLNNHQLQPAVKTVIPHTNFEFPTASPSASSSAPSDAQLGSMAGAQYAPHQHSQTGTASGIGSESILLAHSPYSVHQQQQDPILSSILALNTQQQQRDPLGYGPNLASAIDVDGKVKLLEWHKLPELLLIQQQQQRLRHQEDTFGTSSWYDPQRSRESLREEAFCGPRNSLMRQAQMRASSMAHGGLQQQQQQPANQLPASSLASGEFPSHMGLYNDSVTDDNFVCAATWIHERFALTLASCVTNPNEPSKLMFRLGEWNLNKSSSSKSSTNDQQQQRPMITGQVDQVHIFPKYRNDSGEHNLALVRFAQPVNFLTVPYVLPACQIQARTLLQMSSCWAPTRNVTLVEYFDAEGEGETKERKNISMVEEPVRLLANNDLECQRETKVEFFNFQHPNYICSGDYRKSPQRVRMNTSESFGSGIYCHEGGYLSLVSIVHPIYKNSSSAIGYMDLSYYRPWMRNVISANNY